MHLCACFYFLTAIEWFALIRRVICVHSLKRGKLGLIGMYSFDDTTKPYIVVIVWENMLCVLVLLDDFSSIENKNIYFCQLHINLLQHQGDIRWIGLSRKIEKKRKIRIQFPLITKLTKKLTINIYQLKKINLLQWVKINS